MPELAVNFIGMPGAGKSTLVEALRGRAGFGIFRPSDVIREYAKAQSISLTTRSDYNRAHRQLLQDDPNAMTDQVIRHAAGLLAIDGLRIVAHVQTLRMELGTKLLTCALVCPQDVRHDRILAASEFRAYRDASNIRSRADILADEKSENNPDDLLEPNVDMVVAMHDLSPQPIDTNRPSSEVTEEVLAYLEPHLA